jgi:CheY-like chemotaxis protein
LLARIYSEYLKKAGMPATIVETGAAAMDVLRQTPPQVLLLDLALPDINGMDVLKWVSDQQIPVAVVVITAHASINRVVEAMRLGAYDSARTMCWRSRATSWKPTRGRRASSSAGSIPRPNRLSGPMAGPAMSVSFRMPSATPWSCTTARW